MEAIVLMKPGELGIQSIAEADAPGPGQALVQVERVGICGTDVAGYLGKMPFFSYPRIMGHELGVTVLEVGAGVSNVPAGARCSVEPYINCETCFACRSGHTNCCEHLEVLGVHRDGGMRRRFLMPARKLHPADHLGFEALALVETLAIGSHAVARGNPGPGETVLLIGAGPIGLATLEFLKISGARSIVMDLNLQRLEFCKHQMGADETIHLRGDGTELEQLRSLTNGVLPILAIDATGNQRSMSGALQYVAHSGKVVFVGITASDLTFPHPLMHRRELTLLASRNALPQDFHQIIHYLQTGRIRTDPWITHRTCFAELPSSFEAFTRPETGAIKAMVELS